MKSLEECRAEIFRRSEIRIKKRRQTVRGTLGVCLSAVCLLTASVVLLRSPLVKDRGDGGVIGVLGAPTCGENAGGTLKVFCRIENVENGNAVIMTESTEAEQLKKLIEAYLSSPVPEMASGQGNIISQGTSEGTAQYRFVFYNPLSEAEVYMLCGNILTYKGSSYSVELNAAQLAELLKVAEKGE